MQPESKSSAGQYAKDTNPFERAFIYAVEVLSWPILLTLRIVTVRKIVYRDKASLDLRNNGRQASYVLYANHQSKIDPFLIAASLPSRTIMQLLPFRFFVDNAYLKGPMKVLISIMGGFPAQYEANKPYGLDCARALLRSKQTVVIFPPGKRTRERIAKRGISELATEPDVYLIPVYLDWKSRWNCHIHIGRPLKGGIISSAEALMRHVYNLENIG